MRRAYWKWALATFAVVAAGIGCGSFLSSGEDTAPDVAGRGSFATVDSFFSDAPVSPGGTGGVVDETTPPAGETTRSFFTAYQIDPEAEDTAGPKFVISADIDQDGLLDLVSAWNQSQPIQLHLQRRDANGNISFRTVTIAGTTPVAVVAGIATGQIDDDGFLDIVVLVKSTAFATFCPPEVEGDPPAPLGATDGAILVYFNPGVAGLVPDGDSWTEMEIINPLIADVWIHNQFPGDEEKSFEDAKVKPEYNGFTSLAVGEIDGVEGDDIVVALNPAKCKQLGQEPPINTIDLWPNPGAAIAHNSELWGVASPTIENLNRHVPLSLMRDAPHVKDLALLDMDGDGDLDVIATYPTAISQKIRWARNPFVPHSAGTPGGTAATLAFIEGEWRFSAPEWEFRPLGEVDTGADVIDIGDIDGDTFADVVVRSTTGQIVQWFRHPNPLSVQPEFPPNDEVPGRFNFPWPVFTLTEFPSQEPEAIAVGDVTGDGKLDLVVAAEGGVFWYDGTVAATVYDPWNPNTIIEGEAQATDAQTLVPAPGSGVGVAQVDTSTHINWLLVVDLDADGRRDIIATLDRRSGAGLSDDRLVWYRNTRTEEGE